MSKSRLWTVGTAVLVVAILAIGWFLLISPKRSEASDLKTTAAETEAGNVSTQSQIDQLKAQQKKLPEQRADIEAIKVRLPPAPDQPAVIQQLTEDAALSDVELTSITPAALQAVTGTTGVAYMPLVLAASGTYANVKLFLDAIEEDPRALMITGLNIATSQDDPDLLTVGINARAFVATQPDATANTNATTSGETNTGSSDSTATNVN